MQHQSQSIGWGFEAQGLSRALIEPQGDRVEVGLGEAREIGPSREVLSQQVIGVLVAPARKSSASVDHPAGRIRLFPRRGKRHHPGRRVARRTLVHVIPHGGFTEGADADMTDAELRAAGRHRSARQLPTYAKRMRKQLISVALKRRAERRKAAD